MGLSSQYSIFFGVSFCEIRTRINSLSAKNKKVSIYAVNASSHFKLRSVPSGKLTKLKRALQNEGMAQQNSDVIK